MNENNTKKGFSFKVGRFTITTKHLIAVAIIGVLILVISISSKKKEEERNQQILDELGITEQTETQPGDVPVNVNPHGMTDDELAYLMRINYYSGSGDLSDNAKDQLRLYRKLGDPGAGYIWNDESKRVAISDENMMPQEVVETYIQNIRFLNFAEANKYSTSQATTKAYSKLYQDTVNELDAYTAYQRKLYKLIYENIEMQNVTVGAVFEDGTQHITVTLKSIDLQDKSFITGDVKFKLFEQLWTETKATGDTNLRKEIILNYLYNYYSATLPKKAFDITFVVKKSTSGWVISEDRALTNILTNADGVEASTYILEMYMDEAEALFGED